MFTSTHIAAVFQAKRLLPKQPNRTKVTTKTTNENCAFLLASASKRAVRHRTCRPGPRKVQTTRKVRRDVEIRQQQTVHRIPSGLVLPRNQGITVLTHSTRRYYTRKRWFEKTNYFSLFELYVEGCVRSNGATSRIGMDCHPIRFPMPYAE